MSSENTLTTQNDREIRENSCSAVLDLQKKTRNKGGISRGWDEYIPGTLVPRATKAMALTESLRKMKHPRCPATSPMTAVTRPIIRMDKTKVKYPWNNPVQRSKVLK